MSEMLSIKVVPAEQIAALLTEFEPESPRTCRAPCTAATPARSATPAMPIVSEYHSRLIVDKWLGDRGREFRVKPEPGSKGQSVYVLKCCPFDDSHADPDACIMQEPGGKMSAHCFHNSCQGRGWQEFKEKIGTPGRDHYDPPLPATPRSRRRVPSSTVACDRKVGSPENPTAAHARDRIDGQEGSVEPHSEASNNGPQLPCIQGNRRQLREVSDDTIAALLAANNPPNVFQRGELLTRLRIRAETGTPTLEPLFDSALRGVLSRVANWFKLREAGDATVLEPDAPPMEVVRDVASLPAWDGIPVLEAVVECPVFGRGGQLITTSGFHPEARLWYHPAAGLDVPPVPDHPTSDDLARARDLLTNDLLGDFPFSEEASRAHSVAALILPFVRPMIVGPTPLHLFDAPVEGTGKTLLCNVITVVATGRPAEPTAESSCDEEWRKRLTALLVEGPTFILLDNLNRTLDSAALASVLTTTVWKDRLLGSTRTVTVPNTAVWLASGNNTKLSRELIRRTLLSRLDARVDEPWERTNFRHPNLMGWVQANRGTLVWAALTLCQAWIVAGRPPGRQTLGGFESWTEVVGGILDVSGVPGLLANAQKFRASHADKTSEWRAFAASWWQEHGDQLVGVEQLFTLATRDKLLDSVLGDKGERSQSIRLGVALGKAVDRIYGGYQVTRIEADHRGRQQYRLRQVQAAVNGNVPSVSAEVGEDVQEWSA
jgi:hypothetical protein